jgi:hypothetical protein
MISLELHWGLPMVPELQMSDTNHSSICVVARTGIEANDWITGKLQHNRLVAVYRAQPGKPFTCA